MYIESAAHFAINKDVPISIAYMALYRLTPLRCNFALEQPICESILHGKVTAQSLLRSNRCSHSLRHITACSILQGWRLVLALLCGVIDKCASSNWVWLLLCKEEDGSTCKDNKGKQVCISTAAVPSSKAHTCILSEELEAAFKRSNSLNS